MAYPNVAQEGDVIVSAHMPDFTTGTPAVYLLAPIRGRIVYATVDPQGTSAGSQSTLTLKVNGTSVTGGTLLISQTAGTGTTLDLHGSQDKTNYVEEGDKINFTSDGLSTDGTVAANVNVIIRPTRAI